MQLDLGQVNKQEGAFLPKRDKAGTREHIHVKAIHTTVKALQQKDPLTL